MDGPGPEPIRTPCTNIISVILNFSLSLKLLLTQDRDTTHHPGLLRTGSKNLINEVRDTIASLDSAHGRTYARTVCITWVFGTVQDVQSCSASSFLAVNPPIYRWPPSMRHMMEYNRLRMRPYLKHQPECTMRTTNSYLINLISRSGGLSTS